MRIGDCSYINKTKNYAISFTQNLNELLPGERDNWAFFSPIKYCIRV
jgi:hypothetical protein